MEDEKDDDKKWTIEDKEHMGLNKMCDAVNVSERGQWRM